MARVPTLQGIVVDLKGREIRFGWMFSQWSCFPMYMGTD